MIIQHARIAVSPSQRGEFEAALARVAAVVRQAAGFCWTEFHRSVENPDSYCIRIGWESVSHHVDGFRGSPLFAQWRAAIDPYFAQPPVVEHFRPLPNAAAPSVGRAEVG